MVSGEWGRVMEVLGNPHKPRCDNLFRMMQMMDQEEGDFVGYLNMENQYLVIQMVERIRMG